ncbi:MAG: hypothetical protein AMXMBFR76_21440 [Pseudomonadota bacterium]
MPKITKRLVDATKPTGKTQILWDDSLIGFGLRVFTAGGKSYVLRFRTSDGRQRMATIGKHGPLTPDQAREKARNMLHAISTGADPLAERKAAREALTVEQMATLYQASGRFAEKAPSTQSVDRGRMTRHILPLLGKHRADKLTREDVRLAYAKIRDGKTAATVKTGPRGLAVVKGGEGTAAKAILLLRAMLAWAIEEGILEVNPAAGVKVSASGTRDVILECAGQYHAMFRTLERMEAEHRIRRPAADSIRVIALTGARRGEITGLRWGQVDLKACRVVIPPSEHKTGRKTGKPRIIGLPIEAQAIIIRQPEGAPDDLVFQPATGTNPMSLSKPWRAVRAEAGLPEGIGLHGLRHSLASSMAMQGAQASEIMTAMGHKLMSTAQRYVHWSESRHAQLAERSASHISAALRGTEPIVGTDSVEVKHPVSPSDSG